MGWKGKGKNREMRGGDGKEERRGQEREGEKT